MPSAMLRGRGGAVELVVTGAICLAFAILAPLVDKGRRWARTWVLTLGTGLFLLGLAHTGADTIGWPDLNDYLDTLAHSGLDARITDIEVLVYPGWYAWLEDVAQGLQVLVSLAAVVALAGAAIWHADYFVSMKAETAAPDAWDIATSRIYRETVGAQKPH